MYDLNAVDDKLERKFSLRLKATFYAAFNLVGALENTVQKFSPMMVGSSSSSLFTLGRYSRSGFPLENFMVGLFLVIGGSKVPLSLPATSSRQGGFIMVTSVSSYWTLLSTERCGQVLLTLTVTTGLSVSRPTCARLGFLAASAGPLGVYIVEERSSGALRSPT